MMTYEYKEEPPEQDLRALIEACVTDGYSFGRITKEIRNEWSFVGLRDAILHSERVLKIIAGNGETATGRNAARIFNDWQSQHPGLKL